MSRILQNPYTGNILQIVSKAAENIFLALLAFYLLYLYSFNSTYYVSYPLKAARVLLFGMAGVGAVKIIASMLAAGKWNRKLIPALLLALLYIGLYFKAGKSIFFLFLPVLTVTFIDTNYQKVVKIAVIMGAAFLAASFVGVFGGIIDNFVYFRDGYLRSSWGFGYPTDMASFLLFIIGMGWIAWQDFPDELILLATLLCLWISYTFAASRTTVACCVFFLILVIFHMAELRLFKPRRFFRRISGALQKAATYAYPIMAAAFGICLLLYVKNLPIGLRLNSVLSERLAYTAQIWHDHGIHFFGSVFDAVGNGGNTVSPQSNYFLDCSYSLILIRYGWPLLLVLGILWCAMSRQARNRGDLRLLLMMAMIAVHAFSEHHFVEVMYNILLPLLFAEIPATQVLPESAEANQHLQESTIISYWQKQKARLIAAAVVITVLFLIASRHLGRIRTLIEITGYLGGYAGDVWEKCQILAQMLVLLLLIALSVFALMDEVFRQKARPERHGIRTALLFLLCLTGLFAIYSQETRFISNREDDYTSMLRADKNAMNIILDAAKGDVCVESVPELYQKHFKGISQTVLYGDDLARLDCGTVVTDIGINRQCFTEMGFSFTPISRYHAVYSNDSAVIEALAEAGYTWSDYYSANIEIDLQLMADLNGLKLTNQRTLLFTGPEEKLENGPGLDIYAGTYVLTTELKIPIEETSPDIPICTILITDFYDGHVLQKRELLRSDFDQNGRLTSNITFYTRKGSRNTEFQFIPAEGQQIEILRLQYQKVSK